MREAEMLLAVANSETPERAHALRRRAFTELLPPLLALVERRRVADTLLYGKCAPHEVDWARQYHGGGGRCDASKSALYGQYTGYEAYLHATRLGLLLLSLGSESNAVAPSTTSHKQQLFSRAASALNMMNAPRLQRNLSFYYEATFLTQVRRTMLMFQTRFGLENLEVLAAALGRLNESGVIEERGMEGEALAVVRSCQVTEAKAQAEKVAPGRQLCAHCGAREVHAAHFKRCSACKAVVFCSKDCQLANWPAHKAACKATRKAAADAASSD